MSPVEEAHPQASPSDTEQAGFHPPSDPVATGGCRGFPGFQVYEAHQMPSEVPSIYQLGEQCPAGEFNRGGVM